MNRFSIHYLLSREATETPLNHGRIDAGKCELIFRHVTDIKSCDEFFLCGPETMIHAVNDFLQKNGVEKNRIHFELFTVPGKALTRTVYQEVERADLPDAKSSTVTIKLDGISLSFSLAYQGDVILDAALAAGADVPYACKGGVCASCRAKLLAGNVHMDSNYALEPEELKKGYILTCQSHPRTESVSIDFDAR